MKLIIAGSRTLNVSPMFIQESCLFFLKHISSVEFISGGCPTGIDNSVKYMTKVHAFKYKEFPADWDQYGKAAGPIRNKEMAEYADALLLIWDGSSKGSANMKKEMQKLNKPIYEIIIKGS